MNSLCGPEKLISEFIHKKFELSVRTGPRLEPRHIEEASQAVCSITSPVSYQRPSLWTHSNYTFNYSRKYERTTKFRLFKTQDKSGTQHT